jgi:hypothetical protein
MAKIKIFQGGSTQEATEDLDLINNHMIDPNAGYDNVMMYAEQRMLMTCITSRITEGRYSAPGNSDFKTKVGVIPQGELQDGNAWKYKIMGRIQKSVEIVGNSAVGTPTSGSPVTGGFFSIMLKNNLIYPGMNVNFYNGKMARCESMPTGGQGAWVYTFHCFVGDTFDWATWIAPQMGTKSCFGGYTTYGERSLRGYGNAFYPDHYINHTTKQRKGVSISGDANVHRWYQTPTGELIGWVDEHVAQARAQFLLEDEHEKKWGRSTMKDIYGNLLTSPTMYDAETGKPIITGDGVYPQIEGANDIDASGVDGWPVYDDIRDMVMATKEKSNVLGGRTLYVVCSMYGMQQLSDTYAQMNKNIVNPTYIVTKEEMNKPGGMDFTGGYNFKYFNIAGDTVIAVEDPMMNDRERWPEIVNATGLTRMQQTFYFLDNSIDSNTGLPNIEIRTRGSEGINRNLVICELEGMTGGTKRPTSTVDAKSVDMLKEDVIIVRNTKQCGIITPTPGI